MPSLSFFDRVVSPISIAVMVFLIILLSLGAYLYARKSPVPQQQRVPTQTPTSTPATLPSPTPILGPGTYACDPYGFCNLYEDPKAIGCPKTYADPHCLGQCADQAVRCPK